MAIYEDSIKAACATHGAKTVSDAAYSSMGGDRTPLHQLGLSAKSVADCHNVTVIAASLMTQRERIADANEAKQGLSGRQD